MGLMIEGLCSLNNGPSSLQYIARPPPPLSSLISERRDSNRLKPSIVWWTICCSRRRCVSVRQITLTLLELAAHVRSWIVSSVSPLQFRCIIVRFLSLLATPTSPFALFLFRKFLTKVFLPIVKEILLFTTGKDHLHGWFHCCFDLVAGLWYTLANTKV